MQVPRPWRSGMLCPTVIAKHASIVNLSLKAPCLEMYSRSTLSLGWEGRLQEAAEGDERGVVFAKQM